MSTGIPDPFENLRRIEGPRGGASGPVCGRWVCNWAGRPGSALFWGVLLKGI